jgi:hypothetical protein
LDQHFVRGTLEARDLRFLIQRLEAGFVAGQLRGLAVPDLRPRTAAFRPFIPRQPQTAPVVMTGWGQRAKSGAFKAAEGGTRVSLFSLTPTALYHHVRFEKGVWIQSGGQFGRADRGEPLFTFRKKCTRFNQEMKRIASIRGFPPTGGVAKMAKILEVD